MTKSVSRPKGCRLKACAVCRERSRCNDVAGYQTALCRPCMKAVGYMAVFWTPEANDTYIEKLARRVLKYERRRTEAAR